MRHTNAALLIAEGAHALAIMRRLGHSSIPTTLNVYGHPFPEIEEALTGRLDAIGRAAKTTPTASITALPEALHDASSEPRGAQVGHAAS